MNPRIRLTRFLASSVMLVLVSSGSAPRALACMNDYKPNHEAITRSQSLYEQIADHPTAEPWTTRRDRLRKQSAVDPDFRLRNDLATALAHTGEAAEAITLLEAIEAEKPGLYFTAANLGTVYELAGDDQKAIEWIRRGIERNADAHNGTEWLHVRILEAKLAIAGDPKWLDSNSILGAEVLGNRGETLTTEEIKLALIYQLHERLQFVKPPNEVVGSLLLDLGDLVAKEAAGPGGAKAIVRLAEDYFEGVPISMARSSRTARAAIEAQLGQRTFTKGFMSAWSWFDWTVYFIAGSSVIVLVIGSMRLIQRRRLRKGQLTA